MAPSVIAHRGASGYLPEHTLESKAFAFAAGADYLEQDVVSSHDGTLLVLHDIYLDDVSDVAEKFPYSRRDDGRHYAIDLDIEQLRQLRIFERRDPEGPGALYPNRFPRSGTGFSIVTLEEELEFIAGLNASTGRDVGIYPEIKDPAWHAHNGIDLSLRILDTLNAFGYSQPDDNAFVQCFDRAELQRVREELGCRLPLTQLLSDTADLTAADFESIRGYADGVGLPYGDLVLANGAGEGGLEVAPLARTLQAAGLLCHPYTFRADRLPAYADTLQSLLGFFYADVRVDGVFCDHPDLAVAVRDSLGYSAATA